MCCPACRPLRQVHAGTSARNLRRQSSHHQRALGHPLRKQNTTRSKLCVLCFCCFFCCFILYLSTFLVAAAAPSAAFGCGLPFVAGRPPSVDEPHARRPRRLPAVVSEVHVGVAFLEVPVKRETHTQLTTAKRRYRLDVGQSVVLSRSKTIHITRHTSDITNTGAQTQRHRRRHGHGHRQKQTIVNTCIQHPLTLANNRDVRYSASRQSSV